MSFEKHIRHWFDLDITLRDAALDPQNRATRRMIANACIGMDVNDAYYSVRELRCALAWLHEGDEDGRAKLLTILPNAGCDDFQRCIYFCLAGRGIVEMLDDLEWLEDILEARGRVSGELRRMKTPAMPLVKPYMADAPDGPVVDGERPFTQGPSWYMDPRLEA